MYNELRADQILKTLAALRSRIEERFPGSGLAQVALELDRIGRETEPFLARVRRPNLLLRGAVSIVALSLLTVAALFLYSTVDGKAITQAGDALQLVESAIQDAIFIGFAVYFLFTIEIRLHRRSALKELHRLRTIVHIVDMHQLTKDPEHLFSAGMTTASSPQRRFTRFQMSRYLDYCSELLSLSSKVAALYPQYLNDAVVLDAVNDIEVLAANLSNKIWQKIVILDTAGVPAEG